MEATEKTGEMRQLIGFHVGAEAYGLDILRVREIIRPKGITRLPHSPAFVKGIINLRGEVIPILSLAERFGLETEVDPEARRVIVVEVAGQLVGLMVDAVSAVLRIPAEAVEPPPSMIGGLSREYVAGVGKERDRLVILPNLDRVLSREEQEQLAALDPVGAAACG